MSQIVSMYMRSNKTYLRNVVFASLQGEVSGFHNLIKLLNTFNELDSLIFGVLYSIFLVLNVAQIEYNNQ